MSIPKPRILFVSLELSDTFDELNRPLLTALRAKADVQQVISSSDVIQHLSRRPLPNAVIVTDGAIADRKHDKVLSKLVQYVKSGGIVVFACQFSSFVSPLKMNAMFQNSWNLPWISGSYHRTTFTLNRDVVGLDVRHLSPEYSMKALHLKNVHTNATVYLPTSESRIESLVFPADHITNISETPVAFTSVGNGRLGYLGDVNNEDATTNVILSMCLSPKGTPPTITSTGGTSPVHATTAGPSRQQDTHRKRTVLLISLLKESWIDEVYSQLYSGLHKNAIVHEAKGIKAANKFLSASPPPDAVLVTDAAIQERKHAALLEHLVEYVRVGGRVVLCVQFSNHFEPKHAPSFFQHWGMPWDIGSYHRTTFALNPTGAPEPLSSQALFPSYSMKTQHLKNVPSEAAVYVPMASSRVESQVFAPAPITGAGLHEYPAVFARLGSGFLGYVGDVNGEQPTIRLVLEMCGVKVKPGDLGRRRFMRSISISPNGQTEPVMEEVDEISLPMRRPREDEVLGRAAKRVVERKTLQASAEKLKEEGNVFFRRDDNLKAAEKYREAAFLDGPRPIYMANLAAALLKLELWDLAESAATRALRYDPKHNKARYRRAIASKYLGKYNDALKDLHIVLRLDPTNAAARTELSEVVALCGHQDEDPTDADINESASELAMGSESDDYQHQGNGVPCKFYNHGGCKRGNHCRYMHATDAKSVRDELGRNVCAHWLIDACRFGDRCVYAHDRTYLPRDGWWNDRETVPDVPQLEALLVHSSAWKRDLWATVPYGEPELDEDGDDDEGWSVERDLQERSENFGFTGDEVNELLSYGLKPWDDDAWDTLHAIHDAMDQH